MTKLVAIVVFLLAALPCIASADELTLRFDESPLTTVLDYIKQYSEIGIAYSPTKLVEADGKPIRVTIRMKADSVTALDALAAVAECRVVSLGKGNYAFRVSKELPKTQTEMKLIGTWIVVDEDRKMAGLWDMKLKPDGTCEITNEVPGSAAVNAKYRVVGSQLHVEQRPLSWARRIVDVTDSELILEYELDEDVVRVRYNRAK